MKGVRAPVGEASDLGRLGITIAVIDYFLVFIPNYLSFFPAFIYLSVFASLLSLFFTNLNAHSLEMVTVKYQLYFQT